MRRPTLIAWAIGVPLIMGGCAEWTSSSQSASVTPTSRSQTVSQVPAHKPRTAALLDRERQVVETNNVLAVLQAKQGHYGAAEQLLLASLALAPQASYLYNNLGYVYLLEGRLERAQNSFEQAAHIVPNDPQVRANLAKVTERMAGGTVAGAQKPVAVTVPVAPQTAHIVTATETLTIVTPTAGTLVVAQVAPNVYEIRDPEQKLPAPSAPTTLAKAPPPLRVGYLDVVNGNGVTGMAKRVATQLHTLADLPMARLLNQIPYNQVTTQIQYRSGMLAAATHLQSQLPGHSDVVPMQSTAITTVDIRIVLGHDAVGWPIAWSGVRPTRVADRSNTFSRSTVATQ